VKKIKVERLKSWDEVNAALREIAENELVIDKRETKLNREINALKAAAEKETMDAQNAIVMLETQIKTFAAEHEGEMDGRSKQLFFGRTGFRQTASINIPRGKEEDVIAALHRFGMNDCVAVKASVNKDALKQYADKDIEKVGAKRVVKDMWYYEVDRAKLGG
jgi:phage host-nuclease inhibitor protein Gam